MAITLGVMGGVTRQKGDYAKAVAVCEESLAMLRTLGGKRWIAYTLRLTGHAVRLHGDLERPAGLYRESLALFGEVGDKYVATECIEGLGLIASAQRNSERAARLFGAAETARETFGITMPRTEAGDQEHFWAAIRERPEGTAFAAAWIKGRAMTLEQAIEYALAPVESEKLTGRRRGTRPEGDPLTSREREVAALVARGQTNREIATTLVISERTADAHVQNILNKLGFGARTQIATWATERGLKATTVPEPAGFQVPNRPPLPGRNT